MSDAITVWMFEMGEEERQSILSSNYVKHVEPPCDGSCGVDEPHRHGFGCFKACDACSAICHPECPAYKEKPNG